MSLPDAFHEIAGRVNNWGRWGADDERGTLNLITDAVVREAAAEVRTARRVPLALPLEQDGVQTGMIPGRVNPLHTMVQINQELFGPGTVACSGDAVTMGLQAATHWDALTHVSHSGRLYNGRPADSVTAHGGAGFGGIDKAGPVVSRGVLLDVARARGVDRLDGGHAVTPEDLEAAEEFAGVRVRAGDIVLVRTGQVQVYLAGDRQGVRVPVAGAVGADPGVVPRARRGGGRQRHAGLRDLPAGDRGPVAGRARAGSGGDGDAPGPELESRRVVHSLWRNRAPYVPAVGDARTVHGGDGDSGGTGRGAVDGRWAPVAARLTRPEHGVRAAIRLGVSTPSFPLTLREQTPNHDPHSSRAPVTGTLVVPSRRIAVPKRDQTDTTRQHPSGV